MSHSEKIKIWGECIPYNTGLPKSDVLKPDPGLEPREAMARVFNPSGFRAVSTAEYDCILSDAIKRGRTSERFDDVPYLIPHRSPGSPICVLLCAGGAYLDVSTEDEAIPVAERLCSHGITAFTLNYRFYPYRYPAMIADCRRALRFLRRHAGDFGFSPDKICLGGFSAGGNLAAMTANMFPSLPPYPGYSEDKTDSTTGGADALLLAYSKLIFTDTADLLIPMLGADYFTGDRERLIRDFTVTNFLTKKSPPAFLVHSINDQVVDVGNSLAYAEGCRRLGIPFELHTFLEGGHGYGSARDRDYSVYAPPGDYRGTELWTELFAIWLQKIFEKPGKRIYI